LALQLVNLPEQLEENSAAVGLLAGNGTAGG
jgi:hypothetical protein